MGIYQNLAKHDYEALSLHRARNASELWRRAQVADGMERLRLLDLAQNIGIEVHTYREMSA